MKKYLKYSLLIALIIIGIATGVHASEIQTRYIWNYTITARSIWASADEWNGNTKTNSNNYSVVNWSSSTQSGSHNMWYRVVNSNGAERAIALIPYKSREEIYSTAVQSYNYYLQGKRENSVDPRTTVKGTWNP